MLEGCSQLEDVPLTSQHLSSGYWHYTESRKNDESHTVQSEIIVKYCHGLQITITETKVLEILTAYVCHFIKFQQTFLAVFYILRSRISF